MRRLILLAALLLVTTTASAVEKAQADAWTNQLKKTSALLKQRSYAEALPILRKLNREMLDALGPGDEATYVLVVPLIQTAIAEIGTGDRAAGLWHWHMAQTLYPKSAESDLRAFGEPGAVLKRNLLTTPRLKQCRTSVAATAPSPTVRTAPTYPRGARTFGNQGDFIIDVKIRADGTVAEPRIVRPLPTPLAYAALEAVREWKFKPATRDGAPVDVNFCLAVHYVFEK